MPVVHWSTKEGVLWEICRAVANRILSRKQRILSPGGRVVLLKHVLSSLPIHLLAAASPPTRVLREVERVMAAFLWGTSEFGPRFHWMKWADLCRPYSEGGLGLRRLMEIYQAFSMKLWWNFIQGHSLWASFLAAKYCRDRHPCLAEERARSSYT